MATSVLSLPASIYDRVVAGLLVVTGLAFAIPGIWLIGVGGSVYYAAAGILMAAAGVAFWGRRSLAYGLVLLLVLATMAWAYWEVGLDGWALLPRMNIIMLVGGLTLISWARHRPKRLAKSASPTLVGGVVTAAALIAVGVFALNRDDSARASSVAVSIDEQADWPSIRGGGAADQFSPLQSLTPDNVSGLKVAWTARLGMPTEGRAATLQGTPVKIGDTLYTCNGNNAAVALDSETGRIRWRFDPGLPETVAVARCRGVTYYAVPGANGPCSTRIALQTVDSRLFAIDAATGRLCTAFGKDGQIDLKEGIGEVIEGYLEVTSPATLIRNKLVVGSGILDSQSINEPSGVIRAFDIVTGKLAWAWDMGRPDQHGLPPEGETYTRGTPNAWPPMSADEDLGLVYVPLGNATPDWVSAHRTPEMNKYGSALVALDAENGTVRWHFQTTHRDVWDYDNASPPTLLDFPTPQGLRPAVVQPTKRGQFFVLDRRTGTPLVKTVERPVPQGAVPGETLSPTQPYPVGMPDFGGGRLTEARMWGVTPFEQMWCRIKFREARYDGDFTPLGTDRASIVFPGYLGGSNWGGASIDRDRHIMVAAVNYFPVYNRLVPRADADPRLYKRFVEGMPDYSNWAQEGTPYAVKSVPFISPIGTPCLQPPFSEIAAVDLTTRKVMWRKPLGTARDSGPFGIASGLPIPMGVPAMGGSLVTRSGLVFIGATQEKSFRAFDIRNGKLLWETRLPAGGNANPMSYTARDGRQFIVIAAGGHQSLMNGRGDYLIAYALPRKKKS
ncbi:quinoprotein glucose dehydrogenase [Sphingobium faniae]|nr:quinoprotein glucose dehydrogenase [Sphingobium faniae]